MPNFFAAVASTLWGGADFFGGMASKRIRVQRVGVIAQATGLIAVFVALLVIQAHPQPPDLLWGAAAGVATAGGVLMLYGALAIGPMYVAASLTAVVGALTNASIGLVNGERPGAAPLAGVVL